MKLSEEQKRAVDLTGNIIVSAGAGCGKTATMIERIVRILSDGVPLDRMLIVTFTRAAAAEIRVKLSRRLTELLRAEPNNAVYRAAIDSMPICNIGTLHSYCQKLIRTYFYAAELDPSAVVADGAEAAVIENSCVRAAVREEKANKLNPYFAAVCTMLSDRRSDRGAERAVKKLVDYALSTPDPDGYLSSALPDAVYFDGLDRMAAEKKRRAESECDELLRYAESVGMDLYVRAAKELLCYAKGAAGAEVLGIPSKKRDPDTLNCNGYFKSAREACTACREFLDTVAAAKSIDSEPYVKALCAVAKDTIERYKKRKAELGKLDYSDLEHGARRILADENCMTEIARRIEYVFIDEYQDVNPLQAEIAERFRSSGAKMFLVGDVKQSIYAFRRCNPKFFVETLKNPEYTRVDLTHNYRSSPQVIDFVNGVFSRIMTEDFGGVNYADGHALVAAAESQGSAEFVLVNRDAAESNAAESDGAYSDEAYNGAAESENSDSEKFVPYSVVNAEECQKADPEVLYIVNRILGMLNGADGEIPSSLDKIAVLLRVTSSDFCAELVAALNGAGIKTCVSGKHKLKDIPEAQALIDIARVADNPYDDIALYTALRSPMGGFSDAELLEIATQGETAARAAFVKPDGERYAFYQKVKAYRGRLKDRLDAFEELRKKFALYFSCHDAGDSLGFVTSEIDYFGYLYETYGAESAATVETLMAVAAARKCDIHAFIGYCDSDDFELEVTGCGDAVHIMTVHSSKGLEFERCIVADLSHGFNMDDGRGRVIITDGGAAIKYPDLGEMKLVPSAPWIAANAAAPMRVRAEEMRLLYVALTRAKKQLIVVGKNIKRAAPTESMCMLDLITGVDADVIETVSAASSEHAAQIPAAVKKAERAVFDAVSERCAFVYPRERDGDGNLCKIDIERERAKDKDPVEIPIKTCVTEIAASGEDYTAAAEIMTFDDYSPAESDTDGIGVEKRRRGGGKGKTAGHDTGDAAADSRLRGTAYHKFMELIDFDRPDFDAVAPSVEHAELVDRADIERAVKEMRRFTLNAVFVAKERYFIIDMPRGGESGTANADTEGETSVLVQGVIDFLAVDADGNAVIVDYKTTAVDRLVCDEYITQLRLYALAVERCTPYKVKATYLYSFARGLVEVDIHG